MSLRKCIVYPIFLFSFFIQLLNAYADLVSDKVAQIEKNIQQDPGESRSQSFLYRSAF